MLRLKIQNIIKKYNEVHCVEDKLKTERKWLKRTIVKDVSKNIHLMTYDIVNDGHTTTLTASVKSHKMPSSSRMSSLSSK